MATRGPAPAPGQGRAHRASEDARPSTGLCAPALAVSLETRGHGAHATQAPAGTGRRHGLYPCIHSKDGVDFSVDFIRKNRIRDRVLLSSSRSTFLAKGGGPPPARLGEKCSENEGFAVVKPLKLVKKSNNNPKPRQFPPRVVSRFIIVAPPPLFRRTPSGPSIDTSGSRRAPGPPRARLTGERAQRETATKGPGGKTEPSPGSGTGTAKEAAGAPRHAAHGRAAQRRRSQDDKAPKIAKAPKGPMKQKGPSSQNVDGSCSRTSDCNPSTGAIPETGGVPSALLTPVAGCRPPATALLGSSSRRERRGENAATKKFISLHQRKRSPSSIRYDHRPPSLHASEAALAPDHPAPPRRSRRPCHRPASAARRPHPGLDPRPARAWPRPPRDPRPRSAGARGRDRRSRRAREPRRSPAREASRSPGGGAGSDRPQDDPERHHHLHPLEPRLELAQRHPPMISRGRRHRREHAIEGHRHHRHRARRRRLQPRGPARSPSRPRRRSDGARPGDPRTDSIVAASPSRTPEPIVTHPDRPDPPLRRPCRAHLGGLHHRRDRVPHRKEDHRRERIGQRNEVKRAAHRNATGEAVTARRSTSAAGPSTARADP